VHNGEYHKKKALLMAKPASSMSRRELLLWLAGLSGGALSGACGVGTLFVYLFGRRPLAPVSGQPVPAPASIPLTIVSRLQWGARQPNHEAPDEFGFATPANPLGWQDYSGNLADIYNTVVIHHSYPVRRDTGTMSELQNMHMDFRRWADIGYHFGIGGDGTLYEGRTINARGAHVAGYNTGTIGLVLLGDFEQEEPSVTQLATASAFITYLRTTYALTHLAGHFEFNPETVCPGRYMKPYLDGLAQETGLARGTKGYVPPA
jgi:N-acetylmuramoyl-L-alanine amidase